MDVNKNLEKFRNFFSQNFEICQPAVLCRPEKSRLGFIDSLYN